MLNPSKEARFSFQTWRIKRSTFLLTRKVPKQQKEQRSRSTMLWLPRMGNGLGRLNLLAVSLQDELEAALNVRARKTTLLYSEHLDEDGDGKMLLNNTRDNTCLFLQTTLSDRTMHELNSLMSKMVWFHILCLLAFLLLLLHTPHIVKIKHATPLPKHTVWCLSHVLCSLHCWKDWTDDKHILIHDHLSNCLLSWSAAVH